MPKYEYINRPQDRLYEPWILCTDCRKYSRLRWFIQDTGDVTLSIPHPITGEERLFAKPYMPCASCYHGYVRGARGAGFGELYPSGLNID